MTAVFRKIATYSASLYSATLLSSALSFFVTMVVARNVPKEALGLYGFYVTLYSFAGMVLLSGVNQTLVKFLASPGEDRRQITRLMLTGCAAIAAISWPLAAGAWWLGAYAWMAALIVIPCFVLTAFGNSVFRSEFSKWKEVTNVCAISITNSVCTLAILDLSPRPDLAPISGDLLSYVIPGSVLLFVLARRATAPAAEGAPAPSAAGDLSTLRRIFAFALPLTLAGFAFNAYQNAASILIRGFVGLAALGEYFFAVQLMHLINRPLEILARVVLAGFSAKPDITREEHRRLLTFNMAVFPSMAAGVVFLCPLLLRTADFVFATAGAGGEPLAARYSDAPYFVALFALAVPARCVEFLVSSLAIARGRPEVNRNTHVLAALLALPVLALLVATLGPTGAAIMPLLFQGIFLTVQTRVFRGDAKEIIAQSNRAALLGTLLLAIALLPAIFEMGAAWLAPAIVGYVGAGHLLSAWDLRLLMPRGKKKGRGTAISPATP